MFRDRTKGEVGFLARPSGKCEEQNVIPGRLVNREDACNERSPTARLPFGTEGVQISLYLWFLNPFNAPPALTSTLA
jgi:hypothetical protein